VMVEMLFPSCTTTNSNHIKANKVELTTWSRVKLDPKPI